VNGKVGAGTHKTPAGFRASHHHFSNPPFGYSEKWLRILLRATPRDPIEMLKSRDRSRQNIAEGGSSNFSHKGKDHTKSRAHNRTDLGV
jgi:hypothetical protein